MAYGRNKLQTTSNSIPVNYHTTVPPSGTAGEINPFSFSDSGSKSLGFWSAIHNKYFMLFSPGIKTTPPVDNTAGAIAGNYCYVEDNIVGWIFYAHNGTAWKYAYMYELLDQNVTY